MGAKQAGTRKKEALAYESNFAHLSDELRKLDLIIKRRVIVLRLDLQAMQEACGDRQMYISHQEVDWMLNQSDTFEACHGELQNIDRQIELLQCEINERVAKSMEKGIFPMLPQLAHLFALSPFEVQTIIICLAPELRRKYDKLYAYLQDDITRKKPSIDLVLNLLCKTEEDLWTYRTYFSDNAPLFRPEILHKSDDSQSPSGSSDLASFLKLDQRILNYLLGDNRISGQLSSMVKYLLPQRLREFACIDSEIKTRLLNLTEHYFSSQNINGKKMIIYFHGPYGVGKEELTLAICGNLGCPLLCLDAELILNHALETESLLRLTLRECLLLQSALYIKNADLLLKEEAKAKVFLKKLERVIEEYGWLVLLSGEKPWNPQGIFKEAVFHDVKLPVADVPVRELMWKESLQNLPVDNDSEFAEQLGSQFRLTPGQIRDAARFAAARHSMSNGKKELTLPDLYAACRSQSNHKLEELAKKIEPRKCWNEIILPHDKIEQLKEICSQVRHRYCVFGEWGFEKKLSYGKGLSVLFSGPPGTGKTMAAEVIAHDLQLDLYKIDLSSVVSKYVGETEKNLEKIFREAETSNAILLFDEADALFGKRTEVSDAHDRYANIETSYLLQKMEEYEGVVILASNLRENMDDAFTRRIRFILEFPFPDSSSRQLIWKTHFPKEAPLSDGIDYEFLSKQFQIAGGNIKNVVLNSAFLAAENGGIINMDHIMCGLKREYEKIGKLWCEQNAYKPDQV